MTRLHTWLVLAGGSVLVAVLASCLSPDAYAAGSFNPARAQTNFMLNCQGCHGAQGTPIAGGAVPAMAGAVGNFLRVPGGREFLVQVPGSANAALTDAALAELLNWMLPELSATEMPVDFRPYTTAEVQRLRQTPMVDVAGTRARLIQAIEELQNRE